MANIDPLFEDVARYATKRDNLTYMDIQLHFSIGYNRAMKLFRMLHFFSVTEQPDRYGRSIVKCKDEEGLSLCLRCARQTENALGKFLEYFESAGNQHS